MTSLTLRQTQKLQQKLSPAQIQVIRMLELPSIELQQRINEELQENPVLEEGLDPNKDTSKGDVLDDDSANDLDEENTLSEEYEYAQDSFSDENTYDEDDYVPIQSNPYEASTERDIPSYNADGLIDHLKAQVYLTKMDKPQRHIAKWILGNIDDDGYLRRTVEQLVDDYSFQEGVIIPDEEMNNILQQIKQFDPPGIASYDLRECLLTQLRQQNATPAIQLAIVVLEKYYTQFAKHHFEFIKQRLDLDDQQFKLVCDEITRLNQKPTNAIASTSLDNQLSAVIPDFQVINNDGKLQTVLNTGDIPDLHISSEYKQMLENLSGRDKEASKFLRNRMDSARWFIDAINQRNRTLYLTMNTIMQYQERFFLEGDPKSLQPMILQDLAELTGLDISTISRACNNKYVQTEFGIYPLKFFFSDSITNDQGDEISTREIRESLKSLIDEEDKSNPLTDDGLVDLLRQKGYILARRTIAKYREQLGIPVARLRRR